MAYKGGMSMDFNPAILWLAALIFFIVVEIATVGLTTIWFAGGALIAEIGQLFKAPFWLQVVLFLAVSVVLLLFTRPLAVKYINKNRTKTNVNSLVGKQAIVIEDIDNIKSLGRVRLQGIEWMARTADPEEKAQVDDVVHILAVEGVKLIVTKEKQ